MSSGRTPGREAVDRGAATAELALVLPVLVSLTVGLVWLMSVGLAQARTVDAAREVARAVARGDDTGAAVDRGERIAPDGVGFSVRRDAELVVVRATGRVAGPGGLFARLPGAELEAEAVALEEGS